MDDENYPRPPRRPGSNPNFPPAISEKAKLDAQLQAFLNDFEQDKADGNTIANVRLEIHHLKLTQAEHDTRIKTVELRQDRHGRAIREIKERLNASVDGFEQDTGVHQVEDLRKHLAAKEAEVAKHVEAVKDHRDSIWWRRKKVEWAAAIVGFGVSSALLGFGSIIWYLLTHGK